MTPETVLKELEALKDGDRATFLKSLKSAVKCSFVEKFENGDERPCVESDFSELKKFHEVHILKLKLILQNLEMSDYFKQSSNEGRLKNNDNPNIDIDNELLALIIITCGENIDVRPWNTELSVKHCSEILSIITGLFNCCNVEQLLSKKLKRSLFKVILQILRPKLLATTWKFFPASVACYKWILYMIKNPDLSSHLSSVLPTALLLVDDFVDENRITGVQCLHHIVDNVTVAELQFHGHGNVIYSAIMPLLRIRKPEIIYPTMPCLITLTSKLEIDFGSKHITKWSKFDEILEIYLENMELEQLIALRLCYIENLESLIYSSRASIIRWSKRLLRIFREYIQTAAKLSDIKTTNICLKAIKKFLEESKPVVKLYAKNMLFTLLLALYHIKTETESDVHKESREILMICIKAVLESISESDKIEIQTELKEKLPEIKLPEFCEEVYTIIK